MTSLLLRLADRPVSVTKGCLILIKAKYQDHQLSGNFKDLTTKRNIPLRMFRFVVVARSAAHVS